MANLQSYKRRQSRLSLSLPKQRVGGRARAGIDYQNIKHCQACGIQGPPKDMVSCDGCPMSFHFQCLGYNTITEFKQKEYKSGPGGKSFLLQAPHVPWMQEEHCASRKSIVALLGMSLGLL